MANLKTLGDYIKSTGKKACTFTLPRTNIAPENRPSSSNHQFSGAMFNFGCVRRQNLGAMINISHGGKVGGRFQKSPKVSGAQHEGSKHFGGGFSFT